MNLKRPAGPICAILLAALLTPLAASALITGGSGSNTISDRGWPSGTLAVANLSSRIGWWEGPPFGGGEYQFLYRGDSSAFVRALTNFAAIRTPALELVIHDGPETNFYLNIDAKSGQDARVDWTFTVWIPESWHRLYNNPQSVFDADNPNFRKPVAPPRLDVYVGGGDVGWSTIHVPDNIVVRDARKSAAAARALRADIYDMATGRVIPGARVLVESMAWSQDRSAWEFSRVTETTSDANGRVQVTPVPAGNLRVRVSTDGYATLSLGHGGYVSDGNQHFNVELARSASVVGVVLDDSGAPIRGATVRAISVLALNGRGYSVEGVQALPADATSSPGRFVIANLPVGYVQLSVQAPGYFFNGIAAVHSSPSTNEVLRMTRAGGIDVSVTDKSGNALSKYDDHPLLVEVTPTSGLKMGSWGGSAFVNDKGAIAFDDVPAGEYRINSRPNPAVGKTRYADEQLITVQPAKRVQVKIAYE